MIKREFVRGARSPYANFDPLASNISIFESILERERVDPLALLDPLAQGLGDQDHCGHLAC